MYWLFREISYFAVDHPSSLRTWLQNTFLYSRSDTHFHTYFQESENSGARVGEKTRHRSRRHDQRDDQPTHTTRNTTSLHDPTAADHRTIFTHLSPTQSNSHSSTLVKLFARALARSFTVTLCSTHCFLSISGGCVKSTKYI